MKVYRGQVATACGNANAAMGPFYCPGDRKVYIDLSFYDELAQAFNSPGDFAQAYVIAHEVGHHVQNLLGTMDKMNATPGRADSNESSVRLELQADYYAGVWACHSKMGLPHCPHAGCVMRDAEASIATVDAETGTFCEPCAKAWLEWLQQKGN